LESRQTLMRTTYEQREKKRADGGILMHRRRKWVRGVAKRRRRARGDGGQWQRHYSIRDGTMFWVHSDTLERREVLLPAANVSIEMVESPMQHLADVTSAAPSGVEMTESPLRQQQSGNVDNAALHADAGPSALTVNPLHSPAADDDSPDEENLSDHLNEEPIPYRLDSAGFAALSRYLENQRVLIAIFTTLVIMIYFIYMRVTRSLIDVWSTTKINGNFYLSKSLDLPANTDVHNITRALSAVWICVFSLGTPIAGFSLLVWLYRTGRENDHRWRTAIGFLNDGYRRKYFWWEAVVLVRKLCILLVAVVLASDDGFLQAFQAICVLSVAMLLQAWIQPYESILINVLDIAAMGAVYVTRLGAILFAHFDPTEPNLQTDCDTHRDLSCRGYREILASAIGFALIAIQVVLVLSFGSALLKEKITESRLFRKFFAKRCDRKGQKRIFCKRGTVDSTADDMVPGLTTNPMPGSERRKSRKSAMMPIIDERISGI
jgi:hypothetical protein